MDTHDIPEYFEICDVDQIYIDFLSKHQNNQNEISNLPIINSNSLSNINSNKSFFKNTKDNV